MWGAIAGAVVGILVGIACIVIGILNTFYHIYMQINNKKRLISNQSLLTKFNGAGDGNRTRVVSLEG